MLKEGLEFLLSQYKRPQAMKINGRHFMVQPDGDYDKLFSDQLETQYFSTLDGIIAYTKMLSEIIDAPLYMKVKDNKRVSLHFQEHNADAEIETLAVSECHDYICDIKHLKNMDSEEFIVALLSKFKCTPMRDTLMQVAASVKKEDEFKKSDDGVSQSTVVGHAIKSEVEIKNPTDLRPILTFPEVEQPIIPFIFRISDSITYSLITGDTSQALFRSLGVVQSYLIENLKDIKDIKVFI